MLLNFQDKMKRGVIKKTMISEAGGLLKSFVCSLIFLCPFLTLKAQNDSTAIPSIPHLKEVMSYEVIKTNPLAFLMGPSVITSELGLNYEFSLSKKQSVSIGASLLTKNIFIFLSEKLDTSSSRKGNVVQTSQPLKISGYRFQAQYKFILPLYKYPCGVYIGPHASFSTFNFSYRQRGFTKDFYRTVHQNISLLMGYQHILNNKVFIDLYCGLGYKDNYAYYYKTLTDYKKVDDEFILTGLPIKVKFSMGYYIGFKL